MINKIRAVAKKHGWAIGVHGSLKRDIDLIAVPWTEKAIGWTDLWMILSKKVPLWRGGIEKKAHGRVGCIMLKPRSKEVDTGRRTAGGIRIVNWKPAAIDISFFHIPATPTKPKRRK